MELASCENTALSSAEDAFDWRDDGAPPQRLDRVQADDVVGELQLGSWSLPPMIE